MPPLTITGSLMGQRNVRLLGKAGRALVALVALVVLGGCGYHFKGGLMAPQGVETVAVTVLGNRTWETGIETIFRSLICFRHWHGYRYGKSDIYFVCRLDPVTFQLRCQDEEIEECLWLPVEEYLDSDDVHTFNRRIVRAALDGGGVVREHIEGYGTRETHEFFMPPG